MMILGGIPAKEDQKAPSKSLAGDDSRRHGKSLAKNTRWATIRPTLVKPRPPFACSCRPNQLGRHLRGGMQIFMGTHHCTTSTACLPTWHRGRRWRGCVSTREGAVMDETGLSPVPDKARTPGQDALNAPCHVMRGITSHHCSLSTSWCYCGNPFSYKRRPETTRRRIRLFGAPHAP